MVFRVSQPCTEIRMDDRSIWPQIDTELRVQSMSAIQDRIRSESAAPQPIVKLENGTNIEMQSELKFESFITDADFANYLIVKSDKPVSDKAVYWWYIALPVVIAVLVILTLVFALLAYRRRKVFIL